MSFWDSSNRSTGTRCISSLPQTTERLVPSPYPDADPPGRCFRAIQVDVEQLPAVLIEVAHPAERTMLGHGLPTLIPDPATSEHLIVLRDLLRGALALEGVAHGNTHQRSLLHAVHGSGISRRNSREWWGRYR